MILFNQTSSLVDGLDETINRTEKYPFTKMPSCNKTSARFSSNSGRTKFGLLNQSHNLTRLLVLLICLIGFVPSLASNVRSTKSYDFKETDGSAPGFIMFNLDKIHPSEVFKIESPNRWVSVDTTGAVRVKEPWDYEQLGKEKTIDFWVIITSPNLNGEFSMSLLAVIWMRLASCSFIYWKCFINFVLSFHSL